MEFPRGSVPIAKPSEGNAFGMDLPDRSCDLISLSPALDQATKLFYESALRFSEPSAEFEGLVHQAFDSQSNASVLNTFFSNLTPLWHYYRETGNLISASHLWERALKPVLSWEQSRHGHLHKGTAFYFYGMTAILARDFDRGYLFLHRALEDDMRAAGNQSPDTPAYAVVVINPDLEEQAFRGWVQIQADLVEHALTEYRKKYLHRLGFAQLKSRFLTNEDMREAVFLFSYSVARFFNLTHIPTGTLNSDFGSNLCLNLWFDLTLVIDQAIPAHHPDQWQFINLAVNLSNAAKLGLSRQDLGTINGYFIDDFEGTMKQVLDQTLTVNGRQLIGLAAALAVAYGCRNRGAHHVSSAGVVGDRFPDIFQALLEILFLSVETFH